MTYGHRRTDRQRDYYRALPTSSGGAPIKNLLEVNGNGLNKRFSIAKLVSFIKYNGCK